MNFKTQTVKMTVKKIVKRQQKDGTKLYYIYATVPSIHPKDMIKPATICAAENHFITTTKGFKLARKLKVGDSIPFSLDLLVKDI